MFYDAKRRLAAIKSEENKLNMLNCRKEFIKVKRLAKFNFYNKEKVKMSYMSKASPRKFWKYIKKFRNSNSYDANVSLDDFKKYFQNISNDSQSPVTIDDLDLDRDNINVECLDKEITVEEVMKTISSLKRYKSCDYDNNVSDFFIDANNIISPFLCTIFNYIYDSLTHF